MKRKNKIIDVPTDTKCRFCDKEAKFFINANTYKGDYYSAHYRCDDCYKYVSKIISK